MHITHAKRLSDDLVVQLGSACLRLEEAGSLRRRTPDVGDVELVAIPAIGEFTINDLWGNPRERHHVNHLEDALNSLLAVGTWALALNPQTGHALRNGPNWKKLQHLSTGLLCDLFITTPRQFGYTLTVRTGPAEFSKALVKLAHRRGRFFKNGHLHNHPPVFDAAGDACIRIIPTPEELDVFQALGLPYIEPIDRTLSALMVGARTRA